MNKKPKKQTAAKAAHKAKEQALKKEAAAFFKQDYPKILKKQTAFEYPCLAYVQEGYETVAFEKFLTRKKGVDDGRLLTELQAMLCIRHPEAFTSWAKRVKDIAVGLGYCSWAKKHPKAAADLF